MPTMEWRLQEKIRTAVETLRAELTGQRATTIPEPVAVLGPVDSALLLVHPGAVSNLGDLLYRREGVWKLDSYREAGNGRAPILTVVRTVAGSRRQHHCDRFNG